MLGRNKRQEIGSVNSEEIHSLDDLQLATRVLIDGSGKLMPHRTNYKLPSALPYYREMSGFMPGHRGFGETKSYGKKFSFWESLAYGRTPSDSSNNPYNYQRLAAYWQGGTLLALVHLIDPGDMRGPSKDPLAEPNKGILFVPSTGTLFDHEGVSELRTGRDAQEVYEEFLVPEFIELQETWTPETAYSTGVEQAVKIGKVILGKDSK